MEILLGQKVRCKVSGFTGVVDHMAVYPFGCRRVNVQPEANKKEKTLPESQMIDEPQLEVIDKKQVMSVVIPTAKYAFGQKVREVFSGFEGKITGRALYLNGCARVEITGSYDQKMQKTSVLWASENGVEPIGKLLSTDPVAEQEKAKKSPGGTCNGGSKQKNSI